MNAPADDGPSRDELYERAQELDIEGRSDMNKDELAAAVSEAESSGGEGSVPGATEATPAGVVGGDPRGLRHTPGATTSKTGPVPSPSVVPGSGNIAEAKFNGNRSASRVVTSRDRRAARRERLAAS